MSVLKKPRLTNPEQVDSYTNKHFRNESPQALELWAHLIPTISFV